MKKIMLIIAGLMLATAAPVAAGDYQCATNPCEPPKEEVLQVDIDAIVCGDPRLFAQYENSGDLDSAVKLVFRAGKYKQFNKRVIKTQLDAGESAVIGPRWIRGGGAWVKFRIWDPIAESWSDPPALAWQQQTFGEPWGTLGCPADRFGEPSFETPRYTTK
jgi:hypothetical protein